MTICPAAGGAPRSGAAGAGLPRLLCGGRRVKGDSLVIRMKEIVIIKQFMDPLSQGVVPSGRRSLCKWFIRFLSSALRYYHICEVAVNHRGAGAVSRQSAECSKDATYQTD